MRRKYKHLSANGVQHLFGDFFFFACLFLLLLLIACVRVCVSGLFDFCWYFCFVLFCFFLFFFVCVLYMFFYLFQFLLNLFHFGELCDPEHDHETITL